MWLLVGLGNPGDKYAKNRHNIGFMAIDAIADEYGFPSFRSKFQGQMSEGTIGGEKVVLLKPQTMMNNSGVSVQAAAKFYKIPPEQIIVFHDELDLPPGRIRVKTGGGNAGHNGLRSIQSHLGTPDFVRVRMGIGHPGDKNRVHGYVLSDFLDKALLKRIIDVISENILILLEQNFEEFMKKVAPAGRITRAPD